MTERHELKPNKTAFAFYPIMIHGVVLLFLIFCFYIASLVFPFPLLPIIAGVGGLGLLMMAWVLFVQLRVYQKTKMVFLDDRIIAKGGGIIAEYEKELLFRNITHLHLSLPFVEHKLFQTGTVLVQAAGGSDVEIQFRSFDNPKEIFERLEQSMRDNGFSLSSTNLARHDRPHQPLVFLRSIGNLLITQAVVLLWLVDLIVEATEKPILDQHFSVYILLLVGEFLALAYTLIPLGADLNRRYSLYEDRCEKEVDFFYYRKTLIPIENLSDSILNQGVIERILSAHNLMISCQGSGQGIHFNALRHGNEWKADLDTFSKQSELSPLPQSAIEGQVSTVASNSPQGVTESIVKQPERITKRDTTATETFRMAPKKLFIPPIAMLITATAAGFLSFTFGAVASQDAGYAYGVSVGAGVGGFILFLSGFIRLVRSVLLNITNVYEIKETSLSRSFRFFVSNHVEFQADKVTAMVVNRSLFDRLLGTCSVQFWSIGSTTALKFDHIDDNPERIQTLLAKLGMTADEDAPHKLYQPKADLMTVLSRYLYVLVILIGSVVALAWWTDTLVLALPCLGLFLIYYIIHAIIKARFEKFRLYDEKAQYNRGVFHLTEFHTLYDDVKFIESTRYPFQQTGTLFIEVAGDSINSSDRQSGIGSGSCRFGVPYLYQVDKIHSVADALLLRELSLTSIPDDINAFEAPKRDIHALEKASAAQLVARSMPFALFCAATVVMMFIAESQALINIVIFVTGGLLLLLALIIWMHTKTIEYVIDDQKVLRTRGLLYKQRFGIHFEDIDFIGMNQGVWSKLFSTGDVTINTVGSSKTDLTMAAIPGFRSFYAILKNDFKLGDKGSQSK